MPNLAGKSKFEILRLKLAKNKIRCLKNSFPDRILALQYIFPPIPPTFYIIHDLDPPKLQSSRFSGRCRRRRRRTGSCGRWWCVVEGAWAKVRDLVLAARTCSGCSFRWRRRRRRGRLCGSRCGAIHVTWKLMDSQSLHFLIKNCRNRQRGKDLTLWVNCCSRRKNVMARDFWERYNILGHCWFFLAFFKFVLPFKTAE